jgi:DNA-binding transcriptional LysR family regulator
VQADVAEGRLTRVLADWCPPFSGYHLYYPSRRQLVPAFVLLVNALRFKGEPSSRATRSATRRR